MKRRPEQRPDDGEEARWGFISFLTLRTAEGELYLQRIRLLSTPLFGLFIHKLEVPDPGPDLHDHPWWFASLILLGGYDQWIAETRSAPFYATLRERMGSSCTPGEERKRRWLSVGRIRLHECHKIFRLYRSPTWTLVLRGPRRHSWGFHSARGFEDHRTYDYKVYRDMEPA